MSDELDPGPPPSELKGLLMEHLLTGEPTRAELDRVGRALLQPRGLERQTSRRRFPPELLAAAAVLSIVVGGALIVWNVRAEVQAREGPLDREIFVVLEAGDVQLAEALLTKCARPECQESRRELSRLARKVEEGVPVVADDLEGLAQHSAEALNTNQILSALNAGQLATELRVNQLQREGVAGSKATLAANAFARAHRDSSIEGRRQALLDVLSLVPGTTLAGQARLMFDGLAARESPDASATAPILATEVDLAKEPEPGDEVSAPLPAKEPGDTHLDLIVGTRTRLTAEGLARVAIGDPGIADVRAVRAGLVIEGVAPGTTTMLVWMAKGERRAYTITVRAK